MSPSAAFIFLFAFLLLLLLPLAPMAQFNVALLPSSVFNYYGSRECCVSQVSKL